jgi:hypothetical protein
MQFVPWTLLIKINALIKRHVRDYLRSGHYVYIEASSTTLGRRARLISPRYADPTGVCLKFYYHMYGDGIGIFNIYAKVGFYISSVKKTLHITFFVVMRKSKKKTFVDSYEISLF